MSLESVQTIIGRAVADREYRELLFDEPDRALGGYDLTEEESAALRSLERERFDAVAGELEERISKSGIVPVDVKVPDAGARVEVSPEVMDRFFVGLKKG